MSCKKISFNTLANVLASVSAVGLAGIIGTGTYVYVNREAIIEDVKEKAIEEVLKKVGGGAIGGGALTGDIGLPDTVAARMMGHSVSIHNRTYHHWITRRDQQKAVDTALAKNIA